MEQTWLGEELEVIEEDDVEQTGLGEELELEEDKLEMRELVREEESEYIDEEMGEDK